MATLGARPGSPLGVSRTTGAAGEATYRWLPDWKEPHYYVDVDSTQWVLDGDKQVADNELAALAAPALLERKGLMR